MRRKFGFLLFLMLLVTSLWRPWGVKAHAVPVESSPLDGDVLSDSPQRVMVTFSYKLNPQGSSLVVYDRKGRQVDLGDCGVASIDPSRKSLITTLEKDLPPGKYNIYWTSVTDSEDLHDGHIVTGQLEFYVAEPSWLLFLKGMGLTFGVAAAAGGWLGFGLSRRQLKQLRKDIEAS